MCTVTIESDNLSNRRSSLIPLSSTSWHSWSSNTAASTGQTDLSLCLLPPRIYIVSLSPAFSPRHNTAKSLLLHENISYANFSPSASRVGGFDLNIGTRWCNFKCLLEVLFFSSLKWWLRGISQGLAEWVFGLKYTSLYGRMINVWEYR